MRLHHGMRGGKMKIARLVPVSPALVKFAETVSRVRGLPRRHPALMLGLYLHA